MKPLAIVTTWNRFDLTRQMLHSLAPSAPLLDIVIVDNGSDWAMQSWLQEWGEANEANVILLGENIGCPRALNIALREARQPGQPVIKLDNDILLPPAWLRGVERLVRSWERQGRPLAMVSAYYEPWEAQRVLNTEMFEYKVLFHVWPVVGHAVYHTGAFMDHVGYFDVLAPDHLYGFEDLLMSHKANVMEWGMTAWEGWHIANIQRSSALGGARRDEHVTAMRPLYNERVGRIRNGGSWYTGPDGQPAVYPAEVTCVS